MKLEVKFVLSDEDYNNGVVSCNKSYCIDMPGNVEFSDEVATAANGMTTICDISEAFRVLAIELAEKKEKILKAKEESEKSKDLNTTEAEDKPQEVSQDKENEK